MNDITKRPFMILSDFIATHMTGGSNSFYSEIEYEPMITWTYWRS